MSRRGWVLFLSLSLIWGIPYLLIRVSVESLSPWFVVFARVLMGSAILLPLAAARGELRSIRPYLPWVLVFAIIEITITWPAINFAELHLSSSFTALVIASVPLVAALIAWRLGLDKLTGMRLVGLFVGITGVAALVGLDFGTIHVPSVALLILTVVGYALGPVVVSQRLSEAPSLAVIGLALAINTVIFAPLAITNWPSGPVPATAWWSVIVLGVICTALAFVIFFGLVAEVGPARTTVITFLNPLVALLLGVVVLGEAVTLGMMVGFPLVLLGSWLSTRKAQTAVAESLPA